MITSFFMIFVLLDQSRNGTFFEAGALDGVFHSVSYYLEKSLGWRGMLAEANPRKFNDIIDKSGRTSVLAPICLSPEPKPCLVLFTTYYRCDTISKTVHLGGGNGGYTLVSADLFLSMLGQMFDLALENC